MAKKTIDKVTEQMITCASEKGIEIAWDRLEKMQPQCGFGQMGICCRICTMGPCRIDPFGEGPDRGVCGATADIIAARNLVRMVAGGAAAHSDHGRDIAHTLLMTAEDKVQGYSIKGKKRLMELAAEMGVKTEGRSEKEIAKDVAEKAFAEFGQQHGELQFTQRAPDKRKEVWRKQGVMPRGIDREIVEIMHRTHIGVDNNHENLVKQGLRASLGDGWGGSMIATDLSDVLFGEPEPRRSLANMGVFKEDHVNIVVHGHEPTLSDVIVTASLDPEIKKLAEEAGARGINLTGICCTANEVLMRHGIPLVGNFLQQELAISTGAVELMVVDVQCIMPSIGTVAKCFHTKIVSTSPKAKFPLAEHIEFDETRALEMAKEILRKGIGNYRNRKKELVNIPSGKTDMVAGFTSQYVFDMLGGKYRSTYKPLNDGITSGRLRGAVAIVGCNNPKIEHDSAHVVLTKELIKKDVLVVTTGCSGMASAKAGLMRPEAAGEFAGKGLQEICEAVGIPPVLHMGSCVDISRILTTLCEMVKAGGLGEDISDMPVAGAAPEWMSEKAVSIGFYVIASGVYTVLGVPLPVEGGPELTSLMTDKIAEKIGGKFDFEPDPVKAAELIIKHLDSKREALKLKPMMYE